MSVVKITGSSLNGSVSAIPSKSAAHRALICSFLAGAGTVSPIINSMDMQATTGVLESIKSGKNIFDCIESGSTVRFLIPIAASLGLNATFVGSGRLPSRPLDEYIKLLPKHGVNVKSDGGLPFTIDGKLTNGNYQIAGDVSSQYVTGLLLALANLDGDSAVELTTPLESKPYVDMTVKIMRDYGVNVFETDFGYLIHGGQKFQKIDYEVEGDWSQAAFFLVAGAIAGSVTVTSLDINSTQGDKAIIDVLKAFGADVSVDSNGVTAKKSNLTGTNVNVTDIPDMTPAIAVLASFAKGKTVISGASRLRYKESDRIKSIIHNLNALGVAVQETDDGMIITGASRILGANLKGFNDHRIVMAFSIASLLADGECTIDDAQSINKSYPDFFKDYNRLGGNARVL